ncbi:MAG: electron transfer flavoprotein subunit alpha/FixB family protein [Candidatus Hodgkinia cicadicola]
MSLLAKALIATDALDNVHIKRALTLISCAHTLARKTDMLLINCTLAHALKLKLGAHKLYLVSQSKQISKRASASSLASLVCALSADYDAIVVDGASYWHDIVCRAAATLNAPMLSNVCAVHSAEYGVFARSVYAGKLIQRLECSRVKPWLLSINVPSFNSHAGAYGATATKLQLTQHALTQRCRLLKRELPKHIGLPSLCDANVVIAGGKAFGSAEMFSKHLQPLALKLNAAIGASRSAVDGGLASIDCQIGQTGKTIAPRLYIAFGISGSDHHMVGVKDSELILAVNTDANAPIVKLADYAIIANMFEVIPKMLSLLPQAFE